jgi:CheY-like chemotaxis protein/anti-sigma regulatory factor (Ser/Thr protein kinase)
LTFAKGGAPVKKVSSIKVLIEDSTIFALRGSNVKPEFSFAKNLWNVEIDEGQISEVINNLIINANQAMPDGGVINVYAENVHVSKDDVLPLGEGKYVKIVIEDKGIGISEDYLQKIFDPFFTTKQDGSGLGLATTYSIIKKHDGYIDVKSDIGKGTSFYIYLPASEQEVLCVDDHDFESIRRGTGRVLVMDDEELVRVVAGEMLEIIGYEVEFARDGLEAVEKYRESKKRGEVFDCVILDLTVPGGMGGRELIKELIKIDSGVKAIVSSGYSNDPIMANCRDYGFSGVVPKPYKIKELSKVLYEVIKNLKDVKEDN